VGALELCPLVGSGFFATDHVEIFALRIQKAPATVGEGLDGDLAFMNQAVMPSAKRHEIGELGFAAVSPVLDMMCIYVAAMRAAGKTAAGVPRVQRTADRGWNAARLAADIERLAVRVFEDLDEARVARKTYSLQPWSG